MLIVFTVGNRNGILQTINKFILFRKKGKYLSRQQLLLRVSPNFSLILLMTWISILVS